MPLRRRVGGRIAAEHSSRGQAKASKASRALPPEHRPIDPVASAAERRAAADATESHATRHRGHSSARCARLGCAPAIVFGRDAAADSPYRNDIGRYCLGRGGCSVVAFDARRGEGPTKTSTIASCSPVVTGLCVAGASSSTTRRMRSSGSCAGRFGLIRPQELHIPGARNTRIRVRRIPNFLARPAL